MNINAVIDLQADLYNLNQCADNHASRYPTAHVSEDLRSEAMSHLAGNFTLEQTDYLVTEFARMIQEFRAMNEAEDNSWASLGDDGFTEEPR